MMADLSHWCRVTQMCVRKRIIIGSDNGLSPGRRKALIWTNAGILLIGSLKTKLSEILIKINQFSFKKMSSGKFRPYYLGLNVLIDAYKHEVHSQAILHSNIGLPHTLGIRIPSISTNYIEKSIWSGSITTMTSSAGRHYRSKTFIEAWALWYEKLRRLAHNASCLNFSFPLGTGNWGHAVQGFTKSPGLSIIRTESPFMSTVIARRNSIHF